MTEHLLRGGACAFVLFALVACSSTPSASTSKDAGGPTGTGNSASARIGSAGGVVSTGDGSANVNIPAGAIAGTTTITITPSTSSVPGAVGQVWEIGPTGTQFIAPITISLAYKDAEVGANPASYAVSTVVSNTWQPIAATVVNPATHVISGQTTHLSPYALSQIVNQPVPSDGDGGGIPDGGSDAGATFAPDGAVGSGDGGCGSASCSGCCNQQGTCEDGLSASACGARGLACAPCAAPGACTPVGPCSPDTCSGCCDGTGTCVAGTSNTMCGSGGMTCFPCTGAASCELEPSAGYSCCTTGAGGSKTCEGAGTIPPGGFCNGSDGGP